MDIVLEGTMWLFEEKSHRVLPNSEFCELQYQLAGQDGLTGAVVACGYEDNQLLYE